MRALVPAGNLPHFHLQRIDYQSHVSSEILALRERLQIWAAPQLVVVLQQEVQQQTMDLCLRSPIEQ